MKFKIGDRVRFIRDSTGNDNHMRKGDVGIITNFLENVAILKSKKGCGQINVDGLELTKPQTLRELIENDLLL